MELQGSTPDVADTPEPTPGALLKAAREKAGVSVKDMAAAMRVSLAIINALENDQYEKMAAETFVLGYIRAYVRHLNLSPDVYIAAYQQYRQQHKLPIQGAGEPIRRVEQVMKLNQSMSMHKPSSPWLRLLLWILGLLVVLLLLFSFFGGQIAQQFGIDKSVIISAPALEGGNDVPLGAAGEAHTIANPLEGVATEGDESTGVVDRSSAAADEAATVDAEVSTAPAEQPKPAVVTPEAAPVQAVKTVKAVINNPSVLSGSTNQAGLDTLVFNFTDECWLEVSDSRGDILTVELYQAGSSLTLQGEAPFNVLMGNVRAVKAMINGETVLLQPEGDSKTLRTLIDKL